jgi:hypothetical protein
MQEIYELLQELGINTAGGLSNITGSDISTAFANEYGMTGENAANLQPGFFQTVTQSQEKGLLGKTYSPFMQASHSTLIDDLIGAQSGQQARQVHGGFAGSGAVDVYGKSVKSDYLSGMTESLGGIEEQKARTESGILDLINSWRSTAADIAGVGGYG